MKTHIIQLENDDDIVSIHDKLGWAKTSRILLVWPKNGELPIRRLELVRMQRRAAQLGAQLALVCQHPNVRQHALELGVPIFPETRAAMRTRWKTARRLRLPQRPGAAIEPAARNELRQSSPHAPAGRPLAQHPAIRLSALAASLLALAALAAFFLPSAEITLSPEQITQEIRLPVVAAAGVLSPTLSGDAPARWVTITVEGQRTISATGTVDLPATTASGSVRLTNLTQQAVLLPAETILLTAGETPISFVTTRAITVPQGVGSSASAAVRAMAPGSDGNVPAQSIAMIQGPAGYLLTVANPTATRGGGDLPAPAPTYRDRYQLRQALLADLQASAASQLQAALLPGDVLLTPIPELAQELEARYTPEAGQPGNELALTLRLEWRALVVSGEDLRQIARWALDASLPAGYTPLPGEPALSTSAPPALLNGSYTWEMTAQRTLQARIALPQAIALSAGQEPARAAELLAQNLPLAAAPRIQVSPAWWPRLPWAPFRIRWVEQPAGGQ